MLSVVWFRVSPELWRLFLSRFDALSLKPAVAMEYALAFWMQSDLMAVQHLASSNPEKFAIRLRVHGRCASDARKAARAQGVKFRDVALSALVLWLSSGGDGGRAWAERYELQGVER